MDGCAWPGSLCPELCPGLVLHLVCCMEGVLLEVMVVVVPMDYTWMAVLGLALFVLSFAPG